jgi:hypothetical protein
MMTIKFIRTQDAADVSWRNSFYQLKNIKELTTTKQISQLSLQMLVSPQA